jgi:hypothetical protein
MTTPTTVQVRLQLRSDTAAAWTAANPTLLASELGLESDTNKIKIGNGSTAWNSLAYFPFVVSGGTVLGNLEIGSTGTLTFEGSTVDGFETTLAVANPTADRTITLPNQSGTVIVSGNASIVDADISASAEIAVSKLADGAARQLLQTDAAGTGVEWTSNIDIPGTLDVTGAATFDSSVTVQGDLTVNGTTTTISTQNLLVEDKNIVMGDVATPTDVTADGGGITLKGATDKTINWIDATDAWTSSERFSYPLGSAAAPAVTFTGDPNTGLYSPGADQVAISTNGTGRLFVDASGNVGINTSSPGRIFDIARSTVPAVRLTETSTSKVDEIVRASNVLSIRAGETDSTATSAIEFRTNAQNRMYLTSDGRLGLGSSSPATLFEAKSTTTNLARVRVTGTGTTAGNFRGYEFGNGSVFKGGLLQDESTDLISIFTPVGGQSVNITSAGAVGIGTTSPTANLDVASTGAATNVIVSRSTAGGQAFLSAAGNGSTVGSTSFDFIQDGTGIGYVFNRSAQPLLFGTNNTERARIDSSGRLLVGTSTARATFFNSNYTGPLQVEGANNETGARISSLTYGAAAVSGPVLVLAKHRSNSIGGTTVVQSGDESGVITFQASDGSEFVETARITAQVDGTPGANDMPGRLVFSTTADGASSPTERMRISANGNIDYGSFSLTGATQGRRYSDGGRLGRSSVNSTATAPHHEFYNPNGNVGSIQTDGSSTSYNTSSDYRLKENVAPLTGAIERVNDLQVHRFNFIADPDKTVDGFIAHEAQAVVPECVTGTKDEVDDDGNPVYQGIDQSKLVPLLTAALQEALAEIESLKARVTALEP